MKKLLVIGSGFLQDFVIRKAKSMGYEVLTVDADPKAVGFSHADKYKPINIVEVERVLTNVSERVRMHQLMGNIRQMVDDANAHPPEKKQSAAGNDVDILLGTLGMLGEKGAQDIQRMAQHMIRSGQPFDRTVLEATAAEVHDTTRNIEQRARRAIKKGLTNAANAALDDYTGDIVDGYATYVFDFKTLKEEMDAIRAGGGPGGRITLSRFMDGLIAYCHSV
jgi:two-component system response regulator YcbB